MADEAPTKQDVYYWRNSMGQTCVKLYARALDIVDGNNLDNWIHEIDQDNLDGKAIHPYKAKLVAHSNLQVTGVHPPVGQLTPNKLYGVYFNIRLMHNAKRFKDCHIKFELNDQFGVTTLTPQKLHPGPIKMLVSKFASKPNANHVKAKMYDNNGQEKSGLYVDYLSIEPFEDRRTDDEGQGGGRGQGLQDRTYVGLGGKVDGKVGVVVPMYKGGRQTKHRTILHPRMNLHPQTMKIKIIKSLYSSINCDRK